mmetsp:Transcript_10297/g.30976  ORF Transcript_10297/g.30976 Transcript_10297/m.30976 type:complete len:208 (-) Transcript_10297:149-772(-)
MHLVGREERVPDVKQQHRALARRVVPHLVLVRVVEHEAAPLLPLPHLVRHPHAARRPRCLRLRPGGSGRRLQAEVEPQPQVRRRGVRRDPAAGPQRREEGECIGHVAHHQARDPLQRGRRRGALLPQGRHHAAAVHKRRPVPLLRRGVQRPRVLRVGDPVVRRPPAQAIPLRPDGGRSGLEPRQPRREERVVPLPPRLRREAWDAHD